MRRLHNLQNNFYNKKYKEIYKIVFSADLDYFSDHSSWYYKNSTHLNKITPLWIICESRILNKRIWITHSFNTLEVATAQLNFDAKTNKYDNKSHTSKTFNSQKEMANYLRELLAPCLEQNNSTEGETMYAKCS